MALYYDISIFDFWEMTYGEALETVQARQRREEMELKKRASMDFKLAECITRGIGEMFSKDSKGFGLLDIYGELFKEEKEKNEEEKMKAQLEVNKERMREFANFHNKQRKEE